MSLAPSPADVTPRRAVAVQLAVALLVAISAYEVVTAADDWPFSSYAMFAVLRDERAAVTYSLYGVDAQGQEARLDRLELAPFPVAVLQNTFGAWFAADPHECHRRFGPWAPCEGNRNGRVDAALSDLLERCPRRFAAVRLYRVERSVEPGAAERRTLIAECEARR